MADDPFAMISKFNAAAAAAPQQPAIDLGFGGGGDAATVGGGKGVLVDFGGGGGAAAAPAAEPAAPAVTEVHKVVTLEAANPSGHYSQGMVVPPNASMVYVSAQYPQQAPMAGGANVTGSVTDQTNAALANLMGCLKEAGAADLKSLVKVTVYITDVANLTEFDAAFKAWCGTAVPARTVVPVPALPDGHLVAVEASAAVF